MVVGARPLGLSAVTWALLGCTRLVPTPPLAPASLGSAEDLGHLRPLESREGTPAPSGDPQPLAVPYPPPTVKVELLPPAPAALEEPVWLDGSWAYDGKTWIWRPGRWEARPPGARWVPSRVVCLEGGTFAWYPGGWIGPPRRP